MKLKNRNLFIVIILASAANLCFALSDGIGNPTVVPSSVRSGLVRSPNPLNNGGNAIITGNVRGGMHFRGVVPYGSVHSFEGATGTSEIGSFLRYSAPVNYSRQNAGKSQPYYLPSTTVSSLAPAATGSPIPQLNIKRSGGASEYIFTEAPAKTYKIKPSTIYDYDKARPLGYELGDIERVISYDLTAEKSKQQLSKALHKASEKITSEHQQPDNLTKPLDNTITPLEPAEPLQPGEKPEQKTAEATKTIYQQMLEKIQQLQTIAVEKNPAEEQINDEPEEKEPEPADLESPLSEISEDITKSMVGIHKSFATEAKDKFNYYMRSAEKFLSDGKYYRAADAYAMAGVYKPDDPLVYAGRSHALFASGEYMSAAYFLSRAITIFPQYIDFKIDLNAMLPDKDRLESRIADLKEWIEKTGSAELSFLLAYIYHQLDKNNLAAEQITIASNKIPDSPAINTLKKAIKKNN